VRLRFQPWQIATALALAGALATLVAPQLLKRTSGKTNLVVYLPATNASVVYIDVDGLRRSGMLDMLAGSKTAEEPEYQQFVSETQFDYRRDLDAMAAAFRDGHVYFALRGRFHWKNLSDYAAHQGGSCHNNFCVLPGSQPNRRISFYPLEPDLLAMAIGPDDFAAYQIKRQADAVAIPAPGQPIWAIVPAAALEHSGMLPDSAKPYLSALQGADQIVFSVGPDAGHLQLALHVTCKDAAAASALLANFQGATSTLRQWINQAHQPANPADLTGLLVAGAFRRDDRQVYGQWPIPKAFLDAIAGGSY